METTVKDEEKCAICWGNIQTQCRPDGCQHKFCFECLKKASEEKNQCPECRTHFRRIVAGEMPGCYTQSYNVQPRLIRRQRFNQSSYTVQRVVQFPATMVRVRAEADGLSLSQRSSIQQIQPTIEELTPFISDIERTNGIIYLHRLEPVGLSAQPRMNLQQRIQHEYLGEPETAAGRSRDTDRVRKVFGNMWKEVKILFRRT